MAVGGGWIRHHSFCRIDGRGHHVLGHRWRGAALSTANFGITREIDEQGDVPSALWTVASKKSCFSAMQSIGRRAAGDSHGPLHSGRAVRADIHNWFLLALFGTVLASLLAGSLGLVIGSTVNPKQIGLVFSIIVVPINLFRMVYYPWAWLRTFPG